MHGPSAAVSMLNPDFRDILSALNAERAEYLLVGAYAVAAHGIPRATGDIDLWIRPTAQNAQAVWNALEKFGAALDRLSREDLEKPDLVFQFGVAPQRIDLMTSIEGVDFDAAWSERASFRIDQLEVPTIGLRHLIINKEATGRPQDIADASRLSRKSEE
jgi:hypothetical protein